MRVLIICHSTKTGNTDKIGRVMAECLNARLVKPSEFNALNIQDYDLIGLGSGIFFGKHHSAILQIAEKLPRFGKPDIFIFSTAGISLFSWHKTLRTLLHDKRYRVVAEFSCTGFDSYGVFGILGGINKGKPGNKEIEKAMEFALGLRKHLDSCNDTFYNPGFENPSAKRLKAWHGEEWHTSKGRIIRDIVYAIDTGLVTTVSFLAGVSISLISREKIILAAIIQIIAGTAAIFFGSYISTKAQKHFFENQIERERREIEEDPEKEKWEIRQIFEEMGFNENEREIAVSRITANKERWLKFMAQEEIGISPEFIDNPFEIGFISAGSFLIGALPAILPFFAVFDVREAMIISAVSVLSFLFFVGMFKSRITKIRWFISGFETLL
ncbi:MAG: VIT1/CCC1 transporter family protein, partial [Candidatus Omnitrophica bacterium]|nr:VIT1/CCC1 transporter family protein [Candidatus Omnitrophota bacterium]